MKFIVGLIIGILLVPAAVYVYLSTGNAPVAVKDKSMPFEASLANKALNAQLNNVEAKTPAVDASEANLQEGAEEYMEHCAICHGTRSQDSVMHSSMFPTPPALVKNEMVTDLPAGKTYWIIANGIRLSGMPEFKSHFSDEELWQISQMLANADKLPPSVQKVLDQPMPAHFSGETNQQVEEEQKEHHHGEQQEQQPHQHQHPEAPPKH